MIIRGGRTWQTLNEKIYHNGEQVLQVIRGGVRYYPDYWDWGVFVDRYDFFYDLHDGKLRKRDGLTGAVLEESLTAYEIKVYDGGRFAAVRLDEDTTGMIRYKIIADGRAGRWEDVNILVYDAGAGRGITAASWWSDLAWATDISYLADGYEIDSTAPGQYFEHAPAGFPYVSPMAIFHYYGQDGPACLVIEHYHVGLYDQMSAYRLVSLGYEEDEDGEKKPVKKTIAELGHIPPNNQTHSIFSYVGYYGNYAYGTWPSGALLRFPINTNEETGGNRFRLQTVETWNPETERRYYTAINGYGNLVAGESASDGTVYYEIRHIEDDGESVSLTRPFADRIAPMTRRYTLYESDQYIWYDRMYKK